MAGAPGDGDDVAGVIPDMQGVTGPEPARAAGAAEPPESGLAFDVARDLDDVLEAWRLVYRSYRRARLIGRNPYRLHTVPQAVGPQTLVVCGRIRGEMVSTLSAYLDSEAGLPLETVYPAEIDALRSPDRRLMEIGLFADRRKDLERSVGALFRLMRHVCRFGLHEGATDAVIGVHPHHAGFYRRLLGFQTVGPVRKYPTVNENPVRLLHLDWRRETCRKKLCRGLALSLQDLLDAEELQGRVLLSRELIRGSDIERYLAR